MNRKKIALLLLAVLMLGSCRRAHKTIATWSGDLGEISTVYGDPGKRLSDYHKFEEKYSSIQAEKANLSIRASHGHDVSAEMMIVNRWIGEYNAWSREYDRSAWKSEALPYQIPLLKTIKDLEN